MKAFRLRATTRSERLALFFYSLCLLIMLATRFLHPRHGRQGWSLFLIPVAFFLLLLWNIPNRQLGQATEGPIRFDLEARNPEPRQPGQQ